MDEQELSEEMKQTVTFIITSFIDNCIKFQLNKGQVLGILKGIELSFTEMDEQCQNKN